MNSKHDDRNILEPIIQASSIDGQEIMRVCPHCGEEKPMFEFGYRDMGNNEWRNQSWCRKCR
ncbi:hypothetical protein [Lacticaseibacillus nasuensis]|uniref:hypothetical protein n=1 Tax=Lacticaseibacillus nasuensis TaxID=944671 RepID=UPI0009E9C22C